MALFQPRAAVYVAVTAADFTPLRPWQFPPMLVSAELHLFPVGIEHTQRFARRFNAESLTRAQSPDWDHRWAIVAKCIQRRGKGPFVAAGKGGAL